MENHVISDAELEEFKRDYCCAPGGKYDIEIQLPHLAKLADGYLNKYKRSGDWTDVLKAHALYNSCAVRAQAPDTDIWNRKAFETQELYWRDNRTWDFELQQQVSCTLKEEIEGVREWCRSQLAVADKLVMHLDLNKMKESSFIQIFEDGVKRLSVECTESMVRFAKRVFEFSIASLVVQPPCDFCVVAIGSMAKGEATPYSDLEYMFLVERDGLDVMEYFENLAVSSYFIIGNLQETPLGYMAIDELKGWFDDKQKNGFKIDGLKDGAGNIPTGNGQEHQTNHFIVTPNKLGQRYKMVLDNPRDEAIRGDLTALLQYTRVLYTHGESGENLLNKFNQQRIILQSNSARQEANTKMFISDNKKYGFKPTEALINNGFSINTKRELYRYPSILLFNLSIIFSCSKCNSWETLESLCKNDYISHSIYTSLSFLLACACYFRLSTYLFYDSADDRLSVLPANYFSAKKYPAATKAPEKSVRRWFLSQKLFNLHCDRSVPLKKHFAKCRSQHDISDRTKQQIQQPNWLVKFQTYHCCNRWSKGQGHIQEHIGEVSVLRNPEHTIHTIYNLVDHDFHELWNTVKALTYSLCEIRKDKEALAYHLIIQRMIEAGEGPESAEDQQLIMADSKAEGAYCYYGMTNFDEAADGYASSLAIRSRLLSSNHELLAKVHFCIGRSYNMMYRYKEAEVYLEKALQLCHNQASMEIVHNYYGEVIHIGESTRPLIGLMRKSPEDRLKYLNNPSIILAHVLWTLGITYFYSKYYLRAFLYFNKSRSMFLELYGNEACHRDVAHIMYALSCACTLLDDHGAADVYLKNCIDMTIQLYGKTNRFRASVLHFFSTRSNPTVYIKLLIKVFFSLPRYQAAHAQSATVMNRFGLHLVCAKQHGFAEFVLNYALRTFRSSSTETKYYFAYIANTLSLLALNQWKKGKFKSAEKLFNESLKVLDDYENTYPKCAALERGEILQNMGIMYEHAQNYSRALECYQTAKSNYRLSCDAHNHPKILETENQIRAATARL